MKNRSEWTINLLQQLADSLDQAVVGVDLDGTVRFWNAKAEQLFGWTASEILGQKVETLHPEASDFDELLERCVALGPQVVERTRITKGGERIRVRLALYPIWDRQRRPIGLFALVRRAPETLPLTHRQREILRHIVAGYTDPGIAEILGIKVRTVDAHVAAILAKLGASNRAEASSLAVQFRLLDENVDVGDFEKPTADHRGPHH